VSAAPSPSPVPHDAAFLGAQADLRHQLRLAGLPLLTSAGDDYERAWDRLRLETAVDGYLVGAAS
jgi:hypothetical protein